jgi:hypothetical protein
MRQTIGKLMLLVGAGAFARPQGPSFFDRQRLIGDLAAFASLDPELARALTRYVLDGTDDSALLRLKAISGPDAYKAYFGDHWRGSRARMKRRAAIFRGLHAWDADMLKRYGGVLSIVAFVHSSPQSAPCAPHWPVWLGGLFLVGDRLRRMVTISVELGLRKTVLGPWPCALIGRLPELLRLDGRGEVELIAGLFDFNRRQLRIASIEEMVEDRRLKALIAGLADACATCLDRNGAHLRANLIAYLAANHLIGAGVVLDRVLRLAADRAKGTREAALTALSVVDRALLAERAASMLRDTSVDARLAAVRILSGVIGPSSKAVLEAHAPNESSAKVRQAIAEAGETFAVPKRGGETDATAEQPEAADDVSGYTSVEGDRITIPPMPPLLADGPVPPGTEGKLLAAIAAANAHAQELHTARAVGAKFPFRPPYDASLAADIVAVMSGKKLPLQRLAQVILGSRSPLETIWSPWAVASLDLARILAGPGFTLRHVVRIGCLGNERRQSWFSSLIAENGLFATIIAKRLAEGLDLRVLDALVTDEDGAKGLIIDYFADCGGASLIDTGEVDRAQIWPWAASHFDTFDRALGLAPGPVIDVETMPPNPGATGPKEAVADTLRLLAFLPAVPRRYLQVLIDLATTGPKATRADARAVLAKTKDLTGLIARRLASREQASRVAAAQWLGQRRDGAAVPALRAALAKERTDHGRAALLSALGRLGEDLDPYFADESLLIEARKALPKLRSNLSDWLVPDALPTIVWANGRPVHADVVRYWLLLADKLGEAGGSPLVHMALDRLKRTDAERLGLHVLAAFIAHDTRSVTEHEANAYAVANVDQHLQAVHRFRPDFTREAALAELKHKKLAQYLGSANEHRGILALARHAPAADAVRMVHGFFRDHGQRTAQCLALLDCLAANPVPAALQFVLATSKRYKTASVQRHAGELIAALAEANSWSRDELADHTVPTGGFDEGGTIALPIGDKTYRLVLDNDCRIVIENADGKLISSLPSPSAEPAAAHAKAAGKQLSAARKEVSATLDVQRARLHEAMCCGRVWPVADFEACLLRHPIMARLARRLVFAGLDEKGGIVDTFRPLDDGTLSDAADGVTLAQFAGVKLAHRTLLDEATTQSWRTHLADYEVTPLFEQLDRPVLVVAADGPNQYVISDRQGHMLTTFTLRSAATKLGYQRAPSDDGRYFSAYQKRFEAAGTTALIQFTGAAVPEVDVPCALCTLYFVRSTCGRADGTALPLARVPPVLASEAWNDYHALAATGTSFDPLWQQKAKF